MAITGNQSSEIGDVMLINAPSALSGVFTVTGYTDDTTGETATRFFTKEFRYSTDQGATYTAWLNLGDLAANPIEITALEGLLVEYRYTRAGTDTTGVLEFNSVSLDGTFRTSVLSVLKRATQLFFPTGRAFKTPASGIRDKIQNALTLSEDRALSDAQLILYGLLPDNDRFSTDNASEWELRLGIPNGSALDLEVRKENILRKMRFPGTVPTRQNYRYLEAQLRAAGFDVYVRENRFPKAGGGFEALPYSTVAGVTGEAVHTPLLQHGQTQHGGSNKDLVVNSTERNVDVSFNLNDNFERTFFIGGEIVGSRATAPIFREKEFRQIILQIKPVQTAAFLLIDYDFGDDPEYAYSIISTLFTSSGFTELSEACTFNLVKEII